MRLSHARRAISARFDDPNLVSCAGLAAVLALATRCGLPRLLAQRLTLTGAGAANAAGKVVALVAGMVAGADSISDMDLLRHGGMTRLFDGVRAPSTLGHVLAPVHLRPRPPTRRRRRPSAGRAGPGDTDPARRSPGGVRGHRRHRAPDLRLRQAGRWSRLHRRQRPQRPARGRLDAVVGAGDRRRPTTAGLDQLGARRGQPAHPSAGHRPTSRSCHSPTRPAAGAGGFGVLRLRHRRCLPPSRGPILDHRPDDPHDDPRDRHHRPNLRGPRSATATPCGTTRSSGGSPMPRSPKSSSRRSPDAATPSTSPPG